MSERIKQIVFRVVVIAGITGVLYFIIQSILPLVIPFFIAFIIALIINPFVGFLQIKCKIPRSLGAGIVFGGFISIIAIIGINIWNNLQQQLKNFILHFPLYRTKALQILENCCCSIDEFFQLKTGESKEFFVNGLSDVIDGWKEKIAPDVANRSINVVSMLLGSIIMLFLVVIATVFISKGLENIKEKIKTSYFGASIRQIIQRLFGVLKAYIKAQVIIMILNSLVCMLTLYFIQNPYPITIGILIGFIDALPIFGSGMILIPWGVILLLTEQLTNGLFILIAYLLCNLIRQILEPKIIGEKIGINPLFTLMMMYAGYKIFGFKGFILAPIAFIIGKEIYLFIVSILEPIILKKTKGIFEHRYKP